MFSHVFTPGGLTIPCAIKAASLKWLPLWGTVVRTYIPGMGGLREPPVASVQLTVQSMVMSSE